MPPLLRGVRSVCASLDVTGSCVIKIAAVTAGSEVYEISRESGAAMLLQVGATVVIVVYSTELSTLTRFTCWLNGRYNG